MMANLKSAYWLWKAAKTHGKLYLYDSSKWERLAQESRIMRWTIKYLVRKGRAVDFVKVRKPWTPPA